MIQIRVIAAYMAVTLTGCAATNQQISQCPVGITPQQNVNKQVQFNSDGVMYQGQAFAETSQEADGRAKSAAEHARQDAKTRGSAYGYFSDCTSQGVSVAVQKVSSAPETPKCEKNAQQCQEPCQNLDRTKANFCSNPQQCWRSPRTDHHCSLKIDQGWRPAADAAGVV